MQSSKQYVTLVRADSYGPWKPIYSHTVDRRTYTVWRTHKGLVVLWEEVKQ